MKKYKLKKDLPTFNVGDVFYLSDSGNLFRESDNVPAYSWTTIDKFPNILTDWFEEIKEPTRWKPEVNHVYCFIDNNCDVYCDVWTGSIDQERFDSGNCFQTKEEAERAAEYLKALAVVGGDATTEFIKGKDNYYVSYNAAYNCLAVSDNAYIIKNGIFGLPYFATKEDAKRSIDKHKKEWLTIFGIEEEE